MFIGFDYGTANCSVARMIDGNPELLPIDGDSHYMLSALSAPTRESVSEHLFKHHGIKPSDKVGEQVLRRAINLNREEDLSIYPEDIAFGQTALDRYLEDPSELYYVKSPKSFLGASGLHDVQISFFEDLVCAMMSNIKHNAESYTQQSIVDAVIGRPVNFHGIGGERANAQAESILRRAASRAGFRHIEFQFEPVAAGLEYEATLEQDQLVLVVDIGGGTTDCSLIEMGPSWHGKHDRTQNLLAHSGQRIGGNDLDIHLAFNQFMHELGRGSKTLSGIDIPRTQFWNPIAINNVVAQNDFYGRANLPVLKQLLKEAQQPEKLARLMKVYSETLGYNLVRKAEEAKIALSDHSSCEVALKILSENDVLLGVTRDQMVDAIESPRAKIVELVDEAVRQGGRTPDKIFMTGGSARSPILRQAVESQLPSIPIVSGNYFGSVTAGLARWADVCFT